MEISVFGRKINLELIILIGVVYLIFSVNTFCSCANMPAIMEGIQNLSVDVSGNLSGEALAKVANLKAELANLQQQQQQPQTTAPASSNITLSQPQPSLSNINVNGLPSGKNVTNISTPAAAGKVNTVNRPKSTTTAAKPTASSSKGGKGGKEGFAPASTNMGQSAPYSLTNYEPVNTSAWFPPNLSVHPGKPYSKGVQDILNRPSQPIPLPEGELLMFDNTPFRPECCPSAYSNSTGCACITTGQYNYLIQRGGNNVPYSEY